MIRPCNEEDFDEIWTIIYDGASAYHGIILADCWSKPYMTRETLRREMQDGVIFWGMRSGRVARRRDGSAERA